MYKCVLLTAAAGLLFCAGGALAQDADTVDGFHAYGTPHANALLALDGSARLSGEVIANDSMPGSRLVPGAITAGRLGNNSVTTEKITDGQVMEDDLAAGCVTSSKIANNSVSYVKITDGTVRGEDMYVPLSMTGSRDGGIISATNTKTYFFGKSNPIGVYGYASGAGYVRGVYGRTDSTSGIGTYGYASSTTGTAVGTYGYSRASNGKGVMGYNGSASGTTYGVYGEVRSEDAAYAVYGKRYDGNYGYLGGQSYGVYGKRADNDNHGYLGGSGIGARGWASSENGNGVRGSAYEGSLAAGVVGYGGAPGRAGYFSGDVDISGDLDVTGTKNFKIDHPLDPENMYLYHSCVESSERKNVYDGTVVLDQRGEAWVQLPDWFEVLNGDFRYQLTPIGAPGPNLFVAQEIENGYFKISGGVPGTKVSWMVTGVRQDAYALAHPFEVEVEKPEIERGTYQHPELYGMPYTKSIDWLTAPEEVLAKHGER